MNGKKEKECITGCKSQRRLDDMAPSALKNGNGEGGDNEKGRRRGGEEHASRLLFVWLMVPGLPSVLMLMRRAAAIAEKRPTFPLVPA